MAATNIVEIYAGGWRVNGYYAHTPSWLKAEQGVDETILGKQRRALCWPRGVLSTIHYLLSKL
jgi:hypothetical protein